MSHSSAKFHFPDAPDLHGEYDGTSDVMLPRMYASPEERDENWRKQEWPPYPYDKCPHSPKPCIVHSNYGGGFSWSGEACIPCMRYLGPFDPWEVGGIIKHDSRPA